MQTSVLMTLFSSQKGTFFLDALGGGGGGNNDNDNDHLDKYRIVPNPIDLYSSTQTECDNKSNEEKHRTI